MRNIVEQRANRTGEPLSKATASWRNVKRGDLKLVYVGSTPMVPRSEAIRLGLINE
jgi:hypothetical protein